MMAIIYVRDKTSRQIIHIEESFSSLVWTERYQEAGDFVLDIPIDVADFNVYKKGNYVSFDESLESMVIESIEITEKTEAPVLEIKGRSLSSLLMRRINASKVFTVFDGKLTGTRGPDTNTGLIRYNGAVNEVIQNILNDDLINPVVPSYYWAHKEGGEWVRGYSDTSSNTGMVEYVSYPSRKISNFTYQNLISPTFSMSKSYDELMTLYDILVSIAKEYMFGFRVILNGLNMVLQTYKGVNRTSNQTEVDPIIFDPVMDNISYINYFEDISSYKNSGFAYSDSPLAYAWKNTSPFKHRLFDGYLWVESSNTSDVDRFEVPLDVRSDVSVLDLYSSKSISEVSSEEETTDENTYMSWIDYYEALQNKVSSSGRNAFLDGEYNLIETSEGEIDPLVRYSFEKDYYIGDIVEITNRRESVMTAYISEVIRSYDQNGFITTPSFTNILDYDTGEEETA